MLGGERREKRLSVRVLENGSNGGGSSPPTALEPCRGLRRYSVELRGGSHVRERACCMANHALQVPSIEDGGDRKSVV